LVTGYRVWLPQADIAYKAATDAANLYAKDLPVKGIVSFVIGTGEAFDENGDAVDLRFVAAYTNEEPQANVVLVNGDLHHCYKLDLFCNLLSFWVQPANEIADSNFSIVEVSR